jgi:hypothetical protein
LNGRISIILPFKNKEINMFNFEQFPQIVNHLKSISSRYHKHTSGWIEIFCPWCNDAIRKSNPSHGHLYISPTAPFVNCFRCETKANLSKLLLDTGFQDFEILSYLKQTSNITYQTSKKLIKNNSYLIVKNEIIKQYEFFENNYPVQYNQFKEYIYYRCLDINPIDFFLAPTLINNLVAVQILNSDGVVTNTRLVTPFKSKRYIKPPTPSLYYFQNIDNIIDYTDIIFTEGAFDLINTFSFNNTFDKHSFHIAINDSNYKSALTLIINNFLTIGKYNINIIFDNGLQHMFDRIKRLKFTVNELNPQITLNYFLPTIGKDVSEVMLIKKIEE